MGLSSHIIIVQYLENIAIVYTVAERDKVKTKEND